MANGMNELPGDIRTILEKLENTLSLACEQLNGSEILCRENEEFSSESFWTNFVAATKLVSHEATKICMAFDSGGTLSKDDCQLLVDKVENSCLALLSVFFKLPKNQGKMLHKEIRLYVLSILHGMKSLCSAIRNQSSQLQNVGDVWALSEGVEKVSKNNKDAVIKLCREQHDMVQDASQELLAAMEDEDGSNDLEEFITPINGLPIEPRLTWSNSDRNVLFPSSGLIKAAKAGLKKTQTAISARGEVDHLSSIQELDFIADIVKSSSSLADDFVLSLYPPMNHSLARQQASLVRDNSKELLSTVKSCHFFSEADEEWITFLGKAVDHNWVRISDMVLAD